MGKVKELVDKIRDFLFEVKVELKKVTWPTKKETMSATLIVIVTVFIISFFLGFVDFGLTSLMKYIFS